MSANKNWRRGLSLIACAGTAASAFGQVIDWNNAGGGSWNSAANWLPMNVPNLGSESARFALAGSYTVSGDVSVGIFEFDVTNPSVTLGIVNGIALTFSGPNLVNQGTIVVNPTAGGAATFLRFDAASTVLSGTGQLVLNANAGNPSTAYAQANIITATNSAGHTIRGSGRVIGNWINNGTINADASGRRLVLDSGNRTNNSLIRATGGGTLTVQGGTTTQGVGGRIVGEAGSTAALENTTVVGGTVESIGGGVVDFVGGVTWNGVTPIGPMGIPNGSTLAISGPGFAHNSVFTINTSGGGAATFIRFDAGGTLGGTGTVALNANLANLSTAYVQANGATVTHGPGRTISGTGRIIGNWVNQGVITADVIGRTLQMDSGNRTNNDRIIGTSGGNLRIEGGATTQGPSGRLIASAGGSLTLSNSSTIGGTVEAVGGGVVNLLGVNTWSGVTPVGPVPLANGSTLVISSAPFSHNGIVTINPIAGGAGTFIRFDGAGTLGGTGNLVLNANPGNLNTAYAQANGVTVTNGATHTISGTGRVVGNWANEGLISADAPGRALQMDSGTTTNNSVMQASGGGTLHLSTVATNQSASGRILASGATSTVRLTNSSTNGGTIESVSGGFVELVGGNTWSGVTPVGPIPLANGSSLVISSPPFSHDGVFTINPIAGGAGTFIRFDGAGTLGGTGNLVLNANPGNLDTAFAQANGVTVTNGAMHTIRGTGRIIGNWANEGLINADAPGRTLLMDSGNRSNNNLITATAGGILNVSSGSTIQGASGRISANGGSISLTNTSVIGGVVEGVGGSIASFVLDCAANGVEMRGDVHLSNGSSVVVTGTGLENNGTVTINPTAGGAGTYMRFDVTDVVGGTGNIFLNANPGNLNTAYVQANASTLTYGPGQTVMGRGRLIGNQIMEGTMAPGQSGVNLIQTDSGSFTWRPACRFHAELAGSALTAYDRVTGDSAHVIQGGIVEVSTLGGYVPAFNQTFDLITGGSISGRFSALTAPASPSSFWEYRLLYSPTRVQLKLACKADQNNDEEVDFSDIEAFLALYNAGCLCVDFNNDGEIDFSDIEAYLGLHTIGCIP